MYIIIAGGGAVGNELVRHLVEFKKDIVVIDQNREICDNLFAEFGIETILGNCTRVNVLEAAGIDKADMMISTMTNDADNLAVAVLARSYNIPQIMVLMNDKSYTEAYHTAGVTKILNVVDSLVREIQYEVEKPEIRRIGQFGEGAVEIFLVTVPAEAKIVGKSISEIASSSQLPKESIIAGMFSEKDNEFEIPRGNTTIKAETELFVITRPELVKQTYRFLIAT